MMDELSDGTAQRLLTEKIIRSKHSLLPESSTKQSAFDVSVQIRRTVRQPNDVRSGVLEQIAKLRGELLVAVPGLKESLRRAESRRLGREIPTDLHHERAIPAPE